MSIMGAVQPLGTGNQPYVAFGTSHHPCSEAGLASSVSTGLSPTSSSWCPDSFGIWLCCLFCLCHQPRHRTTIPSKWGSSTYFLQSWMGKGLRHGEYPGQGGAAGWVLTNGTHPPLERHVSLREENALIGPLFQRRHPESSHFPLS